MAESLHRVVEPGDNGVNQAQFLGYLDRYDEVDREIEDAAETMRSLRKRRGDLRKTIKTAGIPLDWFDRARYDGRTSGEARVEGQRWYERMMAWQAKPIGFQATMDVVVEGADDNVVALNVHQLKAVDAAGFAAGKAGHPRGSNPENPGTETAQRWDSSWLRGQAEIAGEMGGAAEPRKRGRPRRDAIAPVPVVEGSGEPDAAPKRRGRPPGSRNRPREETTAELLPTAEMPTAETE